MLVGLSGLGNISSLKDENTTNSTNNHRPAIIVPAQLEQRPTVARRGTTSGHTSLSIIDM